jgi:hypothetical protein
MMYSVRLTVLDVDDKGRPKSSAGRSMTDDVSRPTGASPSPRVGRSASPTSVDVASTTNLSTTAASPTPTRRLSSRGSSRAAMAATSSDVAVSSPIASSRQSSSTTMTTSRGGKGTIMVTPSISPTIVLKNGIYHANIAATTNDEDTPLSSPVPSRSNASPNATATATAANATSSRGILC